MRWKDELAGLKKRGKLDDRLFAETRLRRGAYGQRYDNGRRHEQVKSLLSDLVDVPSFETAPDFYSDWGDPRVYTTGDQGVGECAGEVVSPIEFGLAASERQIFEAQILLDDGKPIEAAERARVAMTEAAFWLTREHCPELRSDTAEILAQFRTHLVDTGTFDAASVGGRFAHYLFRAHELDLALATTRSAHELIEEAQLFVDAAHQYHVRRGPAPSVEMRAEGASP